MMMKPNEATIEIAGLRITAPADLVRLAGWTVHVDGTTRLERDEYTARRLIRALHEIERDYPDLIANDGRVARWALGRVIELGELEGAEARRENARREVATLEAAAAQDRVCAAELELATAKLRGAR